MNAHENETFITRHALLIQASLLGLGFLTLIFFIATLISESKSIFNKPEATLSNPERLDCIKWLAEHDVIVFTPLYEGPKSDSKADFIRWIDEKLNGLPVISLEDKRIRDEDLRHMYYLPGARWLFLDTDTTSVTSAGFQQLYHCTSLERVADSILKSAGGGEMFTLSSLLAGFDSQVFF